MAALAGEQANVTAIVLNCLDATKAGEVLKLLPPVAAKVGVPQLGGFKSFRQADYSGCPHHYAEKQSPACGSAGRDASAK